jgi:radical SAM protein with 4Fe4S-binding SPASM domain
MRLSAPAYIDFNITARCNFKCDFCYASSQPIKDELSVGEIDYILSQCNDLGVLKINLSGGEPFIRKDISEILKLIDNYSLIVFTMNTNASLLTPEHIAEMKRANLAVIGVSLDSPNSEVFRLNRKVEAYNTVCVNIQQLVDSGIKVFCGTTLTKHNVGLIPETIDAAAKLGVRGLSIQFICPTEKTQTNLIPDWNSYSKAILELSILKKQGDLPFSVTLSPVNECAVPWEIYLPLVNQGRSDLLEVWGYNEKPTSTNDVSCVAGQKIVAITADGGVFPCEMLMKQREFLMGNLRKESLLLIWEKWKRNIPSSKKELDKNCQSCQLNFCGGGCRASALITSGHICGPDARCPLALGDHLSCQ